MNTLLILAQLVLAATFALAGVAKLLDLPGSRRAVADFGVPARLASPAGLLLPLAELAAAVALVFHPTARWGALAALVLLLAFIAGIAKALRAGKAPDCHCFGQVHSAPAGRSTLVRNGVLAAIATFVVADGPGPAIDDWVAARSAAQLVAIGAGLVAFAVAATMLSRRSQARAKEAGPANSRPQRPNRPEGLLAGTPAPAFELEDAQGTTRSLDSLLGAGKPVMLAFMELGCSPCRTHVPTVVRWQAMLADRVTIAVVAVGGVDHGSAWEELGVSNVLMDRTEAVMHAFQVEGTPSAVGIWPDGRIASSPAGGLHMPEVLMRMLLRGAPERDVTPPAKPVLPLVRVAPAGRS